MEGCDTFSYALIQSGRLRLRSGYWPDQYGNINYMNNVNIYFVGCCFKSIFRLRCSAIWELLIKLHSKLKKKTWKSRVICLINNKGATKQNRGKRISYLGLLSKTKNVFEKGADRVIKLETFMAHHWDALSTHSSELCRSSVTLAPPLSEVSISKQKQLQKPKFVYPG